MIELMARFCYLGSRTSTAIQIQVSVLPAFIHVGVRHSRVKKTHWKSRNNRIIGKWHISYMQCMIRHIMLLHQHSYSEVYENGRVPKKRKLVMENKETCLQLEIKGSGYCSSLQ